jgi:hypothetical protein
MTILIYPYRFVRVYMAINNGLATYRINASRVTRVTDCSHICQTNDVLVIVRLPIIIFYYQWLYDPYMHVPLPVHDRGSIPIICTSCLNTILLSRMLQGRL